MILRERLRRAGDAMLRATGGAVAVVGGLLVAVLTLALVPLRVVIGDEVVRVPAAVVVAVGGMLALLWFAPRAVGARWAPVLPAVAWFVVTLPAGWTSVRPTASGDLLLLPDDWLAALTLASGSAVAVVGALLAVTAPRPRRFPPEPAG